MSTESRTIEHEGIVTKVEDDGVRVVIVSQSACAACHARGACSVSEMKEKEVEAMRPSFPVKAGDRVRVAASLRNAVLSTLLAYVVPSAVIIATLAGLLQAGAGETIAAIGALGAATIYFFILYLLRNKFARKIKFEVKRLQS